MDLDLSKFETRASQAEEAVQVVINDEFGNPYPAADGKDFWISLRGKESKKYRAARDAITRRNLRARKSKLEPSELRANRVDLVIAVAEGWAGWPTKNGSAGEFSADNLRALLAFDLILEQCEEGIEGHADFFARKSPT